MDEQTLLESLPAHIGFDLMLKATPVADGGKRFVYIEAASEAQDQQGQVLLVKSLQDSVDHFRKFGIIDLEHKSMPSVAERLGIEDPEAWRIGLPVEVKFKDGKTFVKGEIFQGDDDLCRRANTVWAGMTKVSPPHRYYASVGGSVLAKCIKVDAKGSRVSVITKARWNNLALTTEPVNNQLSATASATPIGVFAKSLDGFVIKALDSAGAGTNMATLSGGAALGVQSLDGAIKSYYDFRELLAYAISTKSVGQTKKALVDFSVKQFGLDSKEAAGWVGRFLGDLKNGLKKGAF